MLSRFAIQHRGRPLSRRNFLWELGGGLGGVALTAMLADAGLLAGNPLGEPAPFNPVAPRAPHFAPRAKRVIQVFCAGAVSQVDTYDYKPELIRLQGKPFDSSGKVELFASKPGTIQQSYWKFRQHGQSGRWMSDLLPNLATCVDDMAFIHSMVCKSAVHGPATFMMNSGFVAPGFPSMGAWVTYGLGCETQNLPAFVVIPDSRGVPPGGPVNWGAGFLPASFQGTAVRSNVGMDPIADLFPPADASAGMSFAPDAEADARGLLGTLNARHAAGRAGDSALEARVAAYELAARLQLSAPEATDLANESAATQSLYGLDEKVTEGFGRQCLMARRLIERGVRFVQVWCGADNTAPPRANWDGHEDIVDNHGLHGKIFDKPVAGLLKDLKSRGLLDDTLVICTSEFGRMSCAEQGKGRDHNPNAFTSWLAGGGVKGGVAYGQSDDLSFKAAENPAYCYDLHATALHLLGIDHHNLTFRHNGVARRLTDVHGELIAPILA